MGSSAGCHALGPHLGRTGTRVRLLPVTALWPLMVTGTIWPGSHGDMQSHRLTGLTAGQLGRGICLRTWRPPGRGAGSLRGEDGGFAAPRQMEGLKMRIRPPPSSLTIWRATHSPGNFLNSQLCKGGGGVRARNRPSPTRGSVQGQKTACQVSPCFS